MLEVKFRDRNHKISNLAPAKIIVLSFVILILAGTLMLLLPISSRDGKSVGLLGALFTATSASCVTGLVVVDTYKHWTTFGQIVILLLIQIGGLGMVTLASFFSILLGRKVGLKGMLLAQESLNHFSFEGILKLIRKVVIITFAIELTGALLLSIRFVPAFGAKGFYLGLFHAVSAFCNAGFDLMSIAGNSEYMSFVGYNNDPLVVYTIAALIVIGGLGFIVWKDLYEYRLNKSLLLHTKVVLAVTILLVLSGTIFFFVFEYNNPATMGNLNLLSKINASVFHSITPRTAGFNTLPLDQMREISKVMTIILMFIGAAPGSTAGGIKVTTFGVILIAIISQVKGSGDTIIFKRRVPHYIVNKSISIIGLAAVWIITVTTIMLEIEDKPFLNVLYEVTSAFGTVGLSTGITPSLHSVSKVLLIVTMFLGRVGPLSFAIALTLRRASKQKPDVVYPEGKIVVG